MFPRWLRLSALSLAGCLLVAALFVFVPLYRSLPDRGGRITFPGLADVSALQRDDHGRVTINAQTRRDVAKLLGFAHAQDRFYQMDLLRRTAAGELAELLGPSALPLDRALRRFHLRTVAQAALAQLPEPRREIIEDYALGVSAGLYELESPPIEYLLLGTKPERWQAEDTFLVMATVALLFQPPDGTAELSRALVRDTFDPATAAFLLSAADDFDATMESSPLTPPALPATPGNSAVSATPAALPPLSTAARPAPATDIGSRLFAAWSRALRQDSDRRPGGNAFALQGMRGLQPVAILANDLHLPLGIPNFWYPAELAWRTDPRHIRILDGVTLPGFPFLFAGSNSGMAWGFTGSGADTSDLIALETDPDSPRRYRTPEGWRELETRTESIAVRDAAAPASFTFDSTIWGPVVGTDQHGRPLVLRWTMADPAAYDLEWASFETLNSARAALAFAKSAGMPALNFFAADRDGAIGWTVAGRLPNRLGCDGSGPTSWADGTARWDGWLTRDRYPQVYNPPSGKLWSADNRPLPPADLASLGETTYASGARAAQLRDRLAGLKEFTPEALLALQLDTRGRYLERWQQLLLATLDSTATAGHPARAEYRSLADNWGGQAVPDSAGYRLVHEFRAGVLRSVDRLLFDRCRAAFPDFDSAALPLDRIAYTLASQQPAGWHPEGTAGWRKLLLAAVDDTIASTANTGPLATCTWGQRNQLALRHPLGGAVPLAGFFFDFAAKPVPGDPLVVRPDSPEFGASYRFVIQPGAEDRSLLLTPAGQSAHPLSPYYSDDHEIWLRGEPVPLQPGKVEDHMVFDPAKSD